MKRKLSSPRYHVPKQDPNASKYLKEEEFKQYFNEFGEERAQGYLDAVSHMAEELENILYPEFGNATPHRVRNLLRNFQTQQNNFLKEVDYKRSSKDKPNLSI